MAPLGGALFCNAMDVIYVKQGEYEKGDAAFPLIREAALLYAEMVSAMERDVPEVCRSEKGKPYLKWHLESQPFVGISVTHSEDIWMCMVSEGNCGIDFQYARSLDEQKVAERFFTEEEKKYMAGGGSFYDVWVRREALGKYTGEGFFGTYPDTCPGGVLAECIHIAGSDFLDAERPEGARGSELFFHEITDGMLRQAGVSIEKEMRAAALSESEETPMIVKL